jgi:hypothetical protein
MTARILNGAFQGVYTTDFFEKYWDVVINGQLVSEWTTTDILPTEAEKQYIKLMFADGVYYEGATAEEIEAIENAKIPTQISIMDFRIQLIKIGIEIQDIIDTINSIPTDILSENEKKIILIKLEFASVIDRTDAEFIQIAELMGIKPNQIKTIFNNVA